MDGESTSTTMCKRLICDWLLALLFICAPPLQADCPGSSVPPEAVLALGDATTVQSLDAAFNRVGAENPALLALYRWRRLSLNPTPREELRYLSALPRSASQLLRIYELTYARDVCEHPAVSETVYDMFDTAARLVQKHGRYHQEFVELCLLTDGELGEVSWPAFDWLLAEDSARMVALLRRLPLEIRTQVCDGKDPRELNDQEVVTVCETGT